MSQRKTFFWILVLSALAILGCSRDPQKLVESGKKYIAAGKYTDAVLELRSAVQLNSQLPEAHYQLAIAYLHMAMTRDADQELESDDYSRSRESGRSTATRQPFDACRP